jgi:SAM-dependent methyltransferase
MVWILSKRAIRARAIQTGEPAPPKNSGTRLEQPRRERGALDSGSPIPSTFMIKEIAHFLSKAPEVLRLQRQLPRAEFLDALNDKADAEGYAEVRRELVGDLSGRVLEIGCGTGSLFRYYGPTADIDGIEPESDFLALATAKAAASARTIRAKAGDGMQLAFPDGAFDAVVLCLVLCSVPSVERVLGEARRVLRSGGHLRSLEHVRSTGPIGGRLMDVTNPLWHRLNRQGCNWNRDPVPAMKATGFAVDDLQAFQRFDTSLPAFSMQRIRAHKPD